MSALPDDALALCLAGLSQDERCGYAGGRAAAVVDWAGGCLLPACSAAVLLHANASPAWCGAILTHNSPWPIHAGCAPSAWSASASTGCAPAPSCCVTCARAAPAWRRPSRWQPSSASMGGTRAACMPSSCAATKTLPTWQLLFRLPSPLRAPAASCRSWSWRRGTALWRARGPALHGAAHYLAASRAHTAALGG